MESDCMPSCDVPLPRVGRAYVSTSLDMCKKPPQFEVRFKVDSTLSRSIFVAGNELESRQVGSEYWPLQLDVLFRNSQLDDQQRAYHIKACLQTVRTGTLTCFMDKKLQIDNFDECLPGKSVSKAPVVLVSALLALAFISLLVLVVHCLYTRQVKRKSPRNDSRVYVKENFDEEERLPVIEEVDEKDSLSYTGFCLEGSREYKTETNVALTEVTEIDESMGPAVNHIGYNGTSNGQTKAVSPLRTTVSLQSSNLRTFRPANV